MMTIGILQCGRAPEELVEKHGDYDAMFERLLRHDDFAFVTYAVLEDEIPADVHAADGWLVTGSKFAAYENHPWIPRLEAFLRDAYTRAVPIVGVCFGHQILAQALGGTVEKFSGGWSVGHVEYTVNAKGVVRLPAFHQDQVTVPPRDAMVTGSSPSCRNAFLAYGYRAISMQPHPEFSDAYLQDLIAVRANVLPGEIVQTAVTSAGLRPDSRYIADEIRAFFRTPRTESNPEK